MQRCQLRCQLRRQLRRQLRSHPACLAAVSALPARGRSSISRLTRWPRCPGKASIVDRTPLSGTQRKPACQLSPSHLHSQQLLRQSTRRRWCHRRRTPSRRHCSSSERLQRRQSLTACRHQRQLSPTTLTSYQHQRRLSRTPYQQRQLSQCGRPRSSSGRLVPPAPRGQRRPLRSPRHLPKA